MSTKTAKNNKGKRYTDAEKQEVVDYVNEINSSKGRGGQSAASKKFKISPLTISGWLKKSDSVPTGKSTASVGGSITKKLAKLQDLHGEIARKEKELEKLRAQFEALKGSL
ncbi:transposase-like protein [Haloferula luteola]|uniref:Transposase-like protein n=1 Tax=Haloferula luteola TaxID=595692 RepID=A0A840UV08_9BACT|nr:hypothetical protein [Haloferula luteola]MBB5350027.1 transposase-like protein [Haloferula luteola]